MNYTEQHKETILNALIRFRARYGSANKTATAVGVAAATISAIVNRDWDRISDAMWAKVEAAVKVDTTGDWVLAETRQYKEIEFAVEDAQDNAAVTWVVAEAGAGKTTTAKQYIGTHANAFYVLCAEDTKRSDFVRDLAQAAGVRVSGNTRQMLEQVIDRLNTLDSPVLIFDEADKLTDSVMQYFITIYNRTEGDVGMVFLSTAYIKRRMDGGLRLNKRGYNELHSRFGRKFFDVANTTAQDIYAICLANNIADEVKIKEIITDAAAYDYDLRRVRRAIRRIIKKEMAKNEIVQPR